MEQSDGFYSEDEAHRILSIASRDRSLEGMSRDELVKAAAEMGISAESIERAEREIRKETAEKRLVVEEKKLRSEFNRHLRHRLVNSFAGFLSTAAFFTGIWLFAGMGFYWPGWILFFWGAGLVTETVEAYTGTGRERRYRKWLAKNGATSEFEEESQYPSRDKPGSSVARRGAKSTGPFERGTEKAELGSESDYRRSLP